MDIEALIKTLGGFGRYQLKIYILLLGYSLYDGLVTLSMFFVASKVDFECKLDQYIFTNSLMHVTAPDIRNLTTVESSSCKMFNVSAALFAFDTNAGNISAAKESMSNLSSMECPHGYNFIPGQFKTSIVSEFELVCDREILGTISKACYFVGKLIGFLLTGRLADRYGRKKMFFVCLIFNCVSGFCAAASPNIYFFYVFFLLSGSLGAYSVTFTLVTELVNVKHRLATGVGIHTSFAIGYILLSPIAYLTQNWRYLLVALNVPGVLMLTYWWFLDESFRWLLMKEKHLEAFEVLTKIAKTNRSTLPDDVVLQDKVNLLQNEAKPSQSSLVSLFKNRRTAILTLFIWYIWIINAMVYYGLSLNTGNLSGSIYVNSALTAAVEVPAYIFCMLVVNRIGRKKLFIVAMFCAGVSCILAGLLKDQSVVTALSLFGKLAITASFAIIYTYTAEFFPTDVRNLAVAGSAMVSKFGAISAPFIVQLNSVWQPLPLIVFGVVGLVAVGISFFLPETTGKALPQTVGEMITKKRDRQPAAEGDMLNTKC